MQTQGAPALAGMAHSRAKLDREHPGAIPGDDLEEAPLLSLPVVETLCARLDSADNIDPVENRASAQSPTTMTHGASGGPAHEPCNHRATARSPTTMTHGASGGPAHEPCNHRATARSPTTMTHGASGGPAHEPCNHRATARSPTTMTHGASGVPAHEPSETEEQRSHEWGAASAAYLLLGIQQRGSPALWGALGVRYLLFHIGMGQKREIV